VLIHHVNHPVAKSPESKEQKEEEKDKKDVLPVTRHEHAFLLGVHLLEEPRALLILSPIAPKRSQNRPLRAIFSFLKMLGRRPNFCENDACAY
jgi:hypothetical protein